MVGRHETHLSLGGEACFLFVVTWQSEAIPHGAATVPRAIQHAGFLAEVCSVHMVCCNWGLYCNLKKLLCDYPFLQFLSKQRHSWHSGPEIPHFPPLTLTSAPPPNHFPSNAGGQRAVLLSLSPRAQPGAADAADDPGSTYSIPIHDFHDCSVCSSMCYRPLIRNAGDFPLSPEFWESTQQDEHVLFRVLFVARHETYLSVGSRA